MAGRRLAWNSRRMNSQPSTMRNFLGREGDAVMTVGPWPIDIQDVLAAAERLRPHLDPTPLRSYAELDAAVGHGIHVLVKHENHLPTQAFKVRNGLAALTVLAEDDRRRGVVAATRGNHGLDLLRAGHRAWVLGEEPSRRGCVYKHQLTTAHFFRDSRYRKSRDLW